MQCCTDTTAMWIDDFEDGAPLTVRYAPTGGGNPVLANVATTVGAGINGSIGVRATGPYGQFQANLAGLRGIGQGMGKLPCFDQSGFGGGGYWKFDQFVNGGFYFMEFRNNVSWIMSFGVRESDNAGTGNFPLDICVFNSNISSSTPFVVIKGVIKDPNTFYKIEFSGRLASLTSGSPKVHAQDGFLTVCVDGVELLCYKNSSLIGAGNDQIPIWDQIAIGVMGDFDCLYATDGWLCSLGPIQPVGCVIPGTNQPCGGGGGGGGPGECAPNDNPTSDGGIDCPEHIPPGGETPPDYVRVLGGGIGPTAADPTDPQTMAGIATPLAFMELTLPDATILRLAEKPLSTPAAKVRQARVIAYSPISQVMADHYGRLSAQEARIEFEDTDGVFRGYAADEINNALRNQPVTLWLESDVARRAATAPLKMASLLVRNVTVSETDGLPTFTLECADELSSTESPVSLNRPVPDVLVGDIFPDAAKEFRSVPVPFYFGEYSDEDKWGENPRRVPTGIVPVIGPVKQDKVHLAGSGENLEWWRYLICAFAVKEVVAVFASNLNPDRELLGPVRIGGEGGGEDAEAKHFLLPGQTGWNAVFSNKYEDVVAPNGTTYRLTTMYARGDRAEAHNVGNVRMSVNLKGIEATGDSTGAMIDEAAEIAYFFLNFIALQKVTTGNWPAVPVDVTGTAKTNRASVVSAKARQATWLGDGVRVAWAVRQRKPIADYLAELQFGTGLRIFHDRHQVGVHVMDEVPTLTSLTAFKDDDLIRSTFRMDLALDEIVTQRKYVYGPEAATGSFSGPLTTINSTLAAMVQGETHDAPDVELHPVRRPDMAEAVMVRRMLRFLTTPVYGTFETDLRGVDLAQGQLILVSHPLGLGTSGWIGRVLQVVGIDTSIGAGEGADGMRTMVIWEDVHDLLVLKGSVLESAFWGLMDTEATGNLMGAEGTAGVFCMGSTGA